MGEHLIGAWAAIGTNTVHKFGTLFILHMSDCKKKGPFLSEFLNKPDTYSCH